TTAIEHTGGIVSALDVTASGHERITVDVTVATRGEEHAGQIVEALRALPGVVVDRVSDRTFLLHLGGKLKIESKVPIRNRDDLSMIYTPGVARVCEAIAATPDDARRLTIKRNTIAVVTDGSPVVAGMNRDDTSAPRCFETDARLRAELDIPVFHDDQHGTAIVALAALTNALKVVGKELPDVRIVLSGAGAAGTAVLKLLLAAG